MIRRSLTVAALLIAALLLVTGGVAGAKKRAKCAKYYEQKGCKLGLGERYLSKKPLAGVNVLRASFNFDDVVAGGLCDDGSSEKWFFDTGNASPATEKAVKIGQTQQFDATTIYIYNGEDEIPVQMVGSVTFTSAKKAKLTAKQTAKFPTAAGPSKTCTANISVTLKRVVEKGPGPG